MGPRKFLARPGMGGMGGMGGGFPGWVSVHSDVGV